MHKISPEEAGEYDWVTLTSPRVDQELVGVMGEDRLMSSLEAARQAAIRAYGSEAALLRALKEEGMAAEAAFEYAGERYLVAATFNFGVDKPSMLVMHLDEARERGIIDATDTYWDSTFDR